MFSSKYLLRLDDATPTMNFAKWRKVEKLLDKYHIKPMVGVVPHNEDVNLIIDPINPDFWNLIKKWESKGWTIALHGYNHCYTSNNYGINPFWPRSEFAGVHLELQKDKIRKGIEILKEYDISPKYFFAPSHTFDLNTLNALRQESNIRIISDTIGRYPYKKGGFYFIPQIIGHCTNVPLRGFYTFCLHPNTMDDVDFNNLESFLNSHYAKFIAFDEIDLSKYGHKKFFDHLLSWAFFTYRKFRKLLK